MIQTIEAETHSMKMQFLNDYATAYFSFLDQRNTKELELNL